MGCTKCDTTKNIEKADKSKTLTENKKNVMSRVVYERMSNLSAFKNANVENSLVSNPAITIIKFVPPMTKESALAKYELIYKEQLKLKLSPIKTYADIDKIRDQLWKIDDELYDAKKEYKKVATSITSEDDLLAVRIRIRDALMKETNIQNEVSNLLEQIVDKTPEERIKVIKKEFPDMDEATIKDLLGIGE